MSVRFQLFRIQAGCKKRKRFLRNDKAGKRRNFPKFNKSAETPAKPWEIVLLLVCVLILASVADSPAQSAKQLNERLRHAQNYERLGAFDQAGGLYRALFDDDPRNLVYYLGVKRTYLQLRKYDELLAVIDLRLSTTEDLQTRIDRGDVLYKKQDRDQALAQWREVLKQTPSRETYLAVAAAMMDNRAHDEALRVYLEGREKLGETTAFAQELANLYALRLEFEEATMENLRWLQSDPRQFPQVQRRLSELARDHDASEKVVQALEKALPQARDPESLHRLLATILLQEKKYDQAFEQYQTLDRLVAPAEKNNSGQEIFNFAEEARRASAWGHAEQAYRLILAGAKKSPYRFPALFGLGKSYAEQGKYREALSTFESLLQETGANLRNPWALRALREQGEIYFSGLGEMNPAIDIYRRIYDSAAENNPKEKIDALFRLGDCHLALGDFSQASAWYLNARKLSGKTLTVEDRVNYSLARLEFFQGHFRPAMSLLESVASQPTPVHAAQSESLVNDALELLLLIEGNMSDSAGALLAYAHAEYLTVRQNRRAAIDTLQGMLQTFPQSNLAPQAYFSLGALYAKEGAFDKAVSAYRNVVEHHAGSVVGDRALFRMAEVYAENLQDYAQARRLFEQLLQDYPGSILLEEARKQARSLADRTKSL